MQNSFVPLQSPHFLPHDALRLLLASFLAVRTVVVSTHSLHRRRQQLLTKLLTAQTPATLQGTIIYF
jgi:hypothetical protein